MVVGVAEGVTVTVVGAVNSDRGPESVIVTNAGPADADDNVPPGNMGCNNGL